MFIHQGAWLLKPVTSPSSCCSWLESSESVTEASSCQEVPRSPLKRTKKESHLIKEPGPTPSPLTPAHYLEPSECCVNFWVWLWFVGSFKGCWDAVWLHQRPPLHLSCGLLSGATGQGWRLRDKRLPRCRGGALLLKPCYPAAGLRTTSVLLVALWCFLQCTLTNKSSRITCLRDPESATKNLL